MFRSLGIRLLAALALSMPVAIHAAELGDSQYSPSIGQAGKDVIWVPTPDEMVTAMLNAAGVTSKDLVFDLGAGDGKIAIAAARQFGARAVGIEYEAEMAALAQRNALRAGVGEKVRIIQGDIFKEDFSKATVVTMYLLPELNLRLKPILKKMPPGTRVVSHSFDMQTWEPDQRIETSAAMGYLWIVPAQVEGTWSIQIPGYKQPANLELRQIHQMLTGRLTLDGQTLAIDSARMRGGDMTFQVTMQGGQVLMFDGRVDGDRLSGRMQPAVKPTLISGSRTSKKPASGQ
jgi:SAM-dependent methyltransferase